jgi:hypothetical protein
MNYFIFLLKLFKYLLKKRKKDRNLFFIWLLINKIAVIYYNFDNELMILYPQSQVRVLIYITWYKAGLAWTHAATQGTLLRVKTLAKHVLEIL